MADETISDKDSLPPRVNLQNTDALKAGSGGAPLAAKPIKLKAKPVSKSETAKIPLDVAAAGITIVDDVPHTKTIKIKPVSSPGAIKIGTATAKPAVAIPPAAQIAKSQTSKIPLDAVLPTGGAAPSSGPKTIRLKRPSAGTSKPSVVPAVATVAKIAKDTKADLSKTSRLDIGDAGVDSPVTPTRRKTIRVKRPTSGVAPSLNISRTPESGGGAMPTVGAPLPPMQVEEVEEKCLISGIASILALFVICTLVYVLLAQVTGKNGSLSKLSYFMPEVNLSWPGKIPAN